jgi:hypothetical protein
VACQARKSGVGFIKEGNCLTHISDAAGLAKIADTLSEHRTIGRLSKACERWIYSTCLCFALDLEAQKQSRFHYQYSNYQVEYSRNLMFEIGGQMDQVFQALIDRSRVLLDLKTVRTILGYQRRPRYCRRRKKSAEWEVALERPTYDLTIFKLRCGQVDPEDLYQRRARTSPGGGCAQYPGTPLWAFIRKVSPNRGRGQKHIASVYGDAQLHRSML